MAGHSKWSKIKRKKADNDSKRGKLFTRYLREIQVAAKGGGDVNANARLRTAVQSAKAKGVPNDNIDKAIKRGSGELEGADFEEITYEAYGPGGVAMVIRAMTDNRNRTVSELRHALSRKGGSLGATGCVAYLFDERGCFEISAEQIDENALFELVAEAGAEDLVRDDEVFEVLSEIQHYDTVRATLEQKGLEFEAALKSVPKTLVSLDVEQSAALIELLESLDDCDDVQDVFTNAEFSE